MSGSIFFSDPLEGLERCPHCGVSSPLMRKVWDEQLIESSIKHSYRKEFWANYKCNKCHNCVLIKFFQKEFDLSADLDTEHFKPKLVQIFPEPASVKEEIPEIARNYLRQAQECLHAPDACAVMCGSAVDQMLKTKELTSGSVYSRINDAVSQGVLTGEMGKWAHSVRLGSNRPRHADKERPYVTLDEAKQALEFTKMLGEILFVLPAAIENGRQMVSDDVHSNSD